MLSVLVFVHEFGHFLLAKMNHINVDEFAFGMGPKIVSVNRNGTDYTWRLLPFGGACVMAQDDIETGEKVEGSFSSAPVGRKIATILAGPFFNFLLAFFAAVIVIGVEGIDPAYVTDIEVGSPAYEAGLREGDLITVYQGNSIANARELYIDLTLDGVSPDVTTLTYSRDGESHTISYQPEISERWLLGFSYYLDSDTENGVEITSLSYHYPMERAGFEVGDILVAINGTPITSADELSTYWAEHPMAGDSVEVTCLRNGKEITKTVTPIYDISGVMDFGFNMARYECTPIQTLKSSFGEIGYVIHATVKSLSSIVKGDVTLNDFSGPVGLVDDIGDVYEEAKTSGTLDLVMTMLNMLLLLSVNIGVMNLLPFPALDGGRFVFLVIEAIRGKPVKQSIEGMIHFAGIILLLVFMVVIMFNDIKNIIL